MCGGDCTPSSTPRVGARVDFFSQNQGHLGNLLFLDPSTPSSATATHVRFSPKEGVAIDDRILVSIHLTGDLTKAVNDSGLFQQFTLPGARSLVDQDMALGESLSLNVGHDGIIGRRVSMSKGGKLLADGIVGFNFGPSAVASF
ncbi:hypothetical protein B0T25DRAFT_447855 [Lasiosphaeria hispida]|uniref:Uncharacterized protein n=1 Tax=Lasiosphaeria hispida TaxID=260671 RepID=A0AAJ0HQJ7_9PEZI|nr:hypothetical protein B0T25DRAFT_447855 [Lasiosphaeria hispida]